MDISIRSMLTAGVTMLGLSALTHEHLPATVPAAAVLAWLYLVIAGTLIAFTAYCLHATLKALLAHEDVRLQSGRQGRVCHTFRAQRRSPGP